MGIFDRIILTIYTFALAVVSAAFVALAAGWLAPLDYIRHVLENDHGRWVTGLSSGVFFIASVRLLYFAFRRRGRGRAVFHETQMGEVRIALDAVENLVSRVARHQRGVRDVRAEATVHDGGVSIYLRTWVSPDISIPDLTDMLQREIMRQVRNVVGAEVTEVRIHVVNLAAESRRARVE